MDKEMLTRRISVAAGRELADLVIKNGKIINVFTSEIIEQDLAIVDGFFAGIGHYDGKKVVDAKGAFISPGFIDGHVHIESSMITPVEFAKVLLPHGVTTVITDPHEIGNVSGTEGLQFMLDESDNLPLDVLFMLPSCVPAVAFEPSRAILNIEELGPFFQHPRVIGLAEVMNFPAVKYCDTTMMEKLLATAQAGKKIDGHAAGLGANDLNIYMAAGIKTDHECTTMEEAKDRLQKGMYLMIREGTVAKDLRNLIDVVNDRNSRRCLFVTDDKHLDDLIEEGSIDYNVKLAIEAGIDPITAIQMGTINVAECFGLFEKGAIAPGYQADFLLIDSLEDMKIQYVYKNGEVVAKEGEVVSFVKESLEIPFHLNKTVSFCDVSEADLQIPLNGTKANLIEIIPNSLLTKHIVEEVLVNEGGMFLPSVEKDQLKIVVIERHHMTGSIGLGIVKGLGLKSGAIASTVAHDSHNLIIAGENDSDILFAAEEIRKMQGGLVVVENGKVLSSIQLPISGLISPLPYQEVYNQLKELNNALKNIGASEHFNPFLTLSFLAIPVIPELKITAQGLFHVGKFEHIGLET